MSDPGIPQWQKNTMERIGAGKKRRWDGKWGITVGITVAKELRELLAIVCQARDISRSGYIRRALVKQLAIDTGRPVSELLAMTPRPTPWGVRTAPKHKENGDFSTWTHPPDDGKGFGEWGWDELRP